jgi:serine/threonine protein kinase
MSERFIRCAHCGLPHSARTKVCPTTGLSVDKASRGARRRRYTETARNRAGGDDIGRIIDQKYRLIGRLGAGGMSTVYEAEVLQPRSLGTARVALKVLHPSLADDAEAIARLKQEAEMVRAIGHPNICAVLDMGLTSDAEPYLAMERLYGESLAERIRKGPMSFGELAPAMVQILEALGAAHDQGVLHRDLKPENIFLELTRPGEPPRAKLLDFGVAKSIGYELDQPRLTDTGMVMGTPYYMAPEQARGESRLDARTDLWAIGVIFYEALSGRRPFVANNYNALLVKILTSHPKPLGALVEDLPPPVALLVDKSMAKLREDRYQSAGELIAAVRAAQGSAGAALHSAPRMAERIQDALLPHTRVERQAHYRRRAEPISRARDALPSYEETHEPTLVDQPTADSHGDDTDRNPRPDWDVEADSQRETELFKRRPAQSGSQPAEGVDEHVEDTEIIRKR